MNFEWRGDEAQRATLAGTIRGLNLAAEELRTQSQLLVPEDSGDLKRSVNVEHADERNLESKVSYTTDYAARVHEGVHMNFRTVNNPNAQAKFLEQPARKHSKKFLNMIRTQILRSLGNING